MAETMVTCLHADAGQLRGTSILFKSIIILMGEITTQETCVGILQVAYVNFIVVT
jgi:hypothetical protein